MYVRAACQPRKRATSVVCMLCAGPYATPTRMTCVMRSVFVFVCAKQKTEPPSMVRSGPHVPPITVRRSAALPGSEARLDETPLLGAEEANGSLSATAPSVPGASRHSGQGSSCPASPFPCSIACTILLHHLRPFVRSLRCLAGLRRWKRPAPRAAHACCEMEPAPGGDARRWLSRRWSGGHFWMTAGLAPAMSVAVRIGSGHAASSSTSLPTGTSLSTSCTCGGCSQG